MKHTPAANHRGFPLVTEFTHLLRFNKTLSLGERDAQAWRDRRSSLSRSWVRGQQTMRLKRKTPPHPKPLSLRERGFSLTSRPMTRIREYRTLFRGGTALTLKDEA
jgi:hypothetical protein